MAQDDPKPDADDAALIKAVDDSAPDRPVDIPPVALQEPARPHPAKPDAQRTVPPARPRRGGAGAFFGMVLGGALCAAGGYGAAIYGLLPGADTSAIDARLTEQTQEMAALKSAVADRPAPAADPAMESRLAALEQAPAADAGLADRLAALEAALDTLKSAPATTGGAAATELAALTAQVQALQQGGGAQVEAALAAVQDRIDAAGKEADAIVARATAAAQKSVAIAAVGRIQAALDTGLPFGSALTDLGGDAPAVLAQAAQTGLPTLVTLRDAFPAAARAGLEAALNANMGESWGERVTNFLRSQTGARSLTPREGNDPDAILSRAEAALAQGDAATALAEVRTLPEPAQAAMADWTALAAKRAEAQAAITELATKVGAE